MPALFLSLIACLAVTLAGREGVRVARLSAGLGPGAGLFVAIWGSTIASSAFAAWLGSLIAPLLTGDARLMFVAIALALAGLEVLVLRARPAPREPTRSVGAIGLVLLATQVTDAARFLVLALSLATSQPVLAAVGGALGSGGALTLAAITGARWDAHVPQRTIAICVGLLLLVVAAVLALAARGLLG